MSPAQPLSYCHECNSEVIVPVLCDYGEKHCTECNGTFLEEINPDDDPRNERAILANRDDQMDSDDDVIFDHDDDSVHFDMDEAILPPQNERDQRTPISDPELEGPYWEQPGMPGFFGQGSHTQEEPFPSLPLEAQGDYVRHLQELMDELAEEGMVFGGPGEGEGGAMSGTAIDNLPRGVLSSDSPLIGKDCSICQDTFEPSDILDRRSRHTSRHRKSERVAEGMLTTVTLPCNHDFHEDCIIPWLKERGNCPVCRHELTANSD